MDPITKMRSAMFGLNRPDPEAPKIITPEQFTQYTHDPTKTYSAPAGSLGFEANLPAIADAYQISSNPLDYIFRPVVAIVSDIPNRNGVGFPLSTLTAWNPQRGCLTYATWKGMPMFEEHGKYHPDPDNPDHRLALGVIADVALKPLRGWGGNRLWKVLMLAAIDLTSGHKLVDKDLPRKVNTGEINTYSMGALVNSYICSVCGSQVGRCTHIDESSPVAFNPVNRSIAYRLCVGVEGVELSVVADPAVAIASSDYVRLRYR